MKIGEAASEVPQIKRQSKYAELWARVSALKNGDWIPVTMEVPKKAQGFAAMVSNSRKELQARVRGNVVYLRKRQP